MIPTVNLIRPLLLIGERRANTRFQSQLEATIINITHGSEQDTETAIIVDLANDGMRIETDLAVFPGDALRIDLSDSILLAEVIHCQRTAGRFKFMIGLKLFHSLKYDFLQEVWGGLNSQ